MRVANQVPTDAGYLPRAVALEERLDGLERERRRYQELFDFAPDGYLVTDAGGIIHEANRAAAALLNAQPLVLHGRPLATYIAPEDRRTFRPYLNRLRHAEHLEELWVAVRPRNRSPFQAALTAMPARGDHGEVVEIRWLVRNVSERSRQELALRAQDGFGKRLLEQTAELTVTNTRLRREAERLEKAYGDLAREISTPVLHIAESLLLLPVVGPVSSARATAAMKQLVDAIRTHRAGAVVVDVTGASGLDARLASLFLRAAEAARVSGASIILAGASDNVRRMLLESGSDAQQLEAVPDLRSGIDRAERMLAGRLRA